MGKKTLDEVWDEAFGRNVSARERRRRCNIVRRILEGDGEAVADDDGEDDAAGDQAAGDKMVSAAGELAKRLKSIAGAVSGGHPCTRSDTETISEAAAFLARLAGGDDEEEEAGATEESLAWWREDTPTPMPRAVKRVRSRQVRTLLESAPGGAVRPLLTSSEARRARELQKAGGSAAVPKGSDAQLDWLRNG
jgi:hypothetical protein